MEKFEGENVEQLKGLYDEAKKLKALELPIDRKKFPYTSTLLLYECKRITLAPNQKKSLYADAFPGRVGEEAVEVNDKEVEVDFENTDLSYLRMLVPPGNWQSTGLYAPAGKNITVEVPESVESLEIQIGSHSDELGHLVRRDRAPVIAFIEPLSPGVHQFSSPFDGFIYFIPTKSIVGKKEVIKVSGAVKAPSFVLGKTDLKEWNETIKKYPVPWAELQGEWVIHTIPSDLVLDLDDPVSLMEKWEDFVVQYNDLVGITDNGELPEEEDRQRKIDLFVTMASKISGNNLLEFFRLWGMPSSRQAKEDVSALNFTTTRKGNLEN